jgi:CheY-like chemotaxis protein
MIDDDAGIAMVVGLIARELGMEFLAITSPLIANEVFAAYRPDIVIIDMHLAALARRRHFLRSDWFCHVVEHRPARTGSLSDVQAT